MKKFTFFLSLLLSLSPVSQSGAATIPKSGSACKKIGSTSVLLGKKYTCIKSKNKLVWNNGVLLVKPTVKPVAPTTVKPTTILGSAETNTTTAIKPDIKSTSISFDNLINEYQAITYEAWIKSKNKMLSSETTKTNYHYLTGPSTELFYNKQEQAFSLISRLYSGFANPKDTYILSFNYEDRDWAESQIKRLMPMGEQRWLKGVACPLKERCYGGGVFSDGTGTILIVFAQGMPEGPYTPGIVEAHEYTHAIQQSQVTQPTTWPLANNWPPTWFIEGQGRFSENIATQHDSFNNYLQQRKLGLEYLIKSQEFDYQYILNFFQTTQSDEWFTKYGGWKEYSLGSLLIEILVAVGGPDSTMKIWQLSEKGISFNDSFKQVYGISFSSALPIIAKTMSLELGHK